MARVAELKSSIPDIDDEHHAQRVSLITCTRYLRSVLNFDSSRSMAELRLNKMNAAWHWQQEQGRVIMMMVGS